jgi:hypothetical protein
MLIPVRSIVEALLPVAVAVTLAPAAFAQDSDGLQAFLDAVRSSSS